MQTPHTKQAAQPENSVYFKQSAPNVQAVCAMLLDYEAATSHGNSIRELLDSSLDAELGGVIDSGFDECKPLD